MIATVLRQFPGDWEPGPIPANVLIDETAYVHTVFAFDLCRSERPNAVTLARGAQATDGTMFDVGPRGRVTAGECALLNGVWLLCDREISIGAYTMISWSAVLMDSYRVPRDSVARRELLLRLPDLPGRKLDSLAPEEAKPVRIGKDVWIGFECCILPGVTIGDGAIVGTRSVVAADVEPYTVVAGNPARLVRRLQRPEIAQ
jgi:acetyltransferase-like isoleucine patch superfamily enzyme